MPLTTEEYTGLATRTETHKNKCCDAATYHENNFVYVDDLNVKYKGTPDEPWLSQVADKWTKAKPDELCGLMQEADKIVKAHPPPAPTVTGLTSTQKKYCHGRVTYIKGHLDKLEASAKNAPTVLSQSSKVREAVTSLDTQITADPLTTKIPLKTNIATTRRGLTPRQRRSA